MKIMVFGASGTIGRDVVDELVSRGHEVTAVTRTAPGAGRAPSRVREHVGDVTDAEAVAALSAGQDAIVSAVGPRMIAGEDPEVVRAAARALVAGARSAGVGRLVVVGGAGGLEVADGVRLIDSPQFPDVGRPIAQAHIDALETYRSATDLDWTVLAPPALIEAGPREGPYRVGGGRLLTDETGTSRISTGDYAVALVDELELRRAPQARITVAY